MARVTTALLVVAMFAGGCGSDSSTSTSSKPAQPPMTRSQYIRGGNTICLATVARSPAFPGTRSGRQFSTKSTLMAAYLLAVQSLTVEAQKGIRLLRPPAELVGAHREVLAAQEARITNMGIALNAIQADDVRDLNAAIKEDVSIDAPRYTAAVKAVGLSACAYRR